MAITTFHTGLMLQLVGDKGNWFDVLAEITGYINKQILKEGKWDPDEIDSVYFSIEMPCGHHLDFKTEADIWAMEIGKDIPCSCGDSSHYFVQWIKRDN